MRKFVIQTNKMKNEILVTTDFSVSSKAGLRFAIQLASQRSMPLVVLSVIELLIPTRWNNVKVKIHMDEEIKTETERLQEFVKSVYKESNVRPGKYDCVVRYGAPVDQAIIDFAVERKVDYICMGTRGAGTLRKIVGTLTSSVINQSPVPVFAVPKNYKRSPIKEVLYASDLNSIQSELSKVKRFAAMLKANVNVLHYEYFIKIDDSKSTFDKVAKRYASSSVNFHLQKFDWEQSLAYHIKKAIRKFQPSIVVLFTKQDRNWYERLFFGSKSADVSYDTKKPILVFPKTFK